MTRSLPWGRAWHCEGCKGTALTLLVIRKAQPQLAERLWTAARATTADSQGACAVCRGRMKLFHLEDGTGAIELDACVGCEYIWFDGAELSQLRITLDKRKKQRTEQASASSTSSASGDSGWEVEDTFDVVEIVFDVFSWIDW